MGEGWELKGRREGFKNKVPSPPDQGPTSKGVMSFKVRHNTYTYVSALLQNKSWGRGSWEGMECLG